MNLRKLLYLLQLEEYDLKRFNDWLKKNPGRVVEEKKKKIVWTPKAHALFWLTSILDFLTFKKLPALSLTIAVYILTPFDWAFKKVLIARARSKIKKNKNLIVIGITGSYGKTTTRDAISHILSQKFPGQVVKTEENYNTLLGVAKTILKNLKHEHRIFVCEMGAYKRGDIKKIADLIKPKIGIITAVNEMHLERFGSLEKTLKTKMELIEALPADGAGFINENIKPLFKQFAEVEPPTEVRPLKIKIDYFSNQNDLLEKIGALFEIKKEEIQEFLKTLPPTPHRAQISKTAANITIIDDTYNSNPQGFLRALEILQKTAQDNNAAKKILVTPGMIELGEQQFELNKKIANQAAEIADYFIIVGETNREALTAGLKEKLNAEEYPKNVFEVKDLEQAQMVLSSIAVSGSAILFENDLPDHYF